MRLTRYIGESQMQSNRINDISLTDLNQMIVEAQLAKKPKERACLLCGKVTKMRSDQHFCSGSCRTAYHREAAAITLNTVRQERERLLRVEQDLLTEIRELKLEIARLQQLTKEP